MTVKQLIERLEEMNPQSEVRLAEQPRWAFEYSISDVAETNLENDSNGEHHRGKKATSVVYISEGTQLGYLPSEAKEAIGW
jgi:hypothetical protein